MGIVRTICRLLAPPLSNVPPREGETYRAPRVHLPDGAKWFDQHNACVFRHSISSGSALYALTYRLTFVGEPVPSWARTALWKANLGSFSAVWEFVRCQLQVGARFNLRKSLTRVKVSGAGLY